MPEFTLDEADHCPHCNAIVRLPPNCCKPLQEEEYEAAQRALLYLMPEEGEIDFVDW